MSYVITVHLASGAYVSSKDLTEEEANNVVPAFTDFTDAGHVRFPLSDTDSAIFNPNYIEYAEVTKL